MWVGNCIGAENIKEAKEYMKISNQMVALIILIVCINFVIFSNDIILIFTSNDLVITVYLSIVPLLTLSLFPDLWQGYI